MQEGESLRSFRTEDKTSAADEATVVILVSWQTYVEQDA